METQSRRPASNCLKIVMGSLIDQQEERRRATGGSTIPLRQRRVVVCENDLAYY
jgi:hypothetical protein